MIKKDELRNLIPHAGSMCLLDFVEEWSAEHIRCTTRTHNSIDNPLRFENRLAAVHLLEYAAQSMAAHGALVASNSSGGDSPMKSGMLAAGRNVRFHVDRLDTLTDPITIFAQRRLTNSDGLIYDFKAHAADMLLCEGRIIVALGLALGPALEAQ